MVTWPDSTEEILAWFTRCVLLAILSTTSMLSIASRFIFRITEHKPPAQERLAIRACYTISTSYFLWSFFFTFTGKWKSHSALQTTGKLSVGLGNFPYTKSLEGKHRTWYSETLRLKMVYSDMSYNHFFLFSSMRAKNTNHQRALLARRAIISVWHLGLASMSSVCFVLASQELWRRGKRKKKVILWLSRNKSLATDFIIINTSQLPSLHIPHSHCYAPSRSEVKAFLMTCYFFKWVESGQKKWQTSCIGQRQMSFCVLTWVMFTVVKSFFAVSVKFLTGNAFWGYKHSESFSVNLGFSWIQVKREL